MIYLRINRCSTLNPLHNLKGNFCVNCNEKFIFSFSTFEVLPLVELYLEDDLDDDEILRILEEANKSRIENTIKENLKKKNENENQWFEEKDDNAEFLKLKSNENQSTNNYMESLNIYNQEKLDKEKFANLNLNEVLVLDWPVPLRKQFFRNMVPEISISKCPFCNKFFQTDDFETQILTHGCCTFCRTPQSIQNKN